MGKSPTANIQLTQRNPPQASHAHRTVSSPIQTIPTTSPMLKSPSVPLRSPQRGIALAICLLFTAATSVAEDPAALAKRGKQLYVAQCASCHGDQGQGVNDRYEEPLFGDLAAEDLARVIHETMPSEKPEACVDQDALAVAEYMIGQFYTAEARAKNQPPRITLSRLTVEQYDNVLSDLVSHNDRIQLPKGKPGLKAQYYNARNTKADKLVIERVDPKIKFDFGQGSPDEKIGNEEFSINWSGLVIADETGDYEFTVATGNGVKLYVNDDRKPLIDGWVSSGGERRELTESIHLLGGRSYRLKLNFFKHRDKSASVELMWKPPHRPRQVIPSRSLRDQYTRPLFVSTTPLPPDDASFGFPRGTAVSKSWDEATTAAAVDAAAAIVDQIDRLAKTKPDAADRREKIIKYCNQFVERAFRRPLDDEQRKFFVESQFAATDEIGEAVKRCVILTLKSPRFLYPTTPFGEVDSYDVASQISFALWDSIPDQRLMKVAKDGQLMKPDAVRKEVVAAVGDARTRAKLRGFFRRWLSLERAEEMSKDSEQYPQFSPELVADLRLSLDLFLEEVFWGDAPDYRRLLLSDTMYVNQRIADFYKIPHPADKDADDGERFVSVSLKGEPRAGVVTHPLVLAALAYHNDTSPIHRGVFVTRNLLGRVLNPPPIATVFEAAAFDPHLTMREKVSELTKSSQCQGCHHVINPLGFSLENYDAVGQYRTTEKARKIEAASDYKSVSGKVIRLEGARDLALHAAESEAAQKGFIRQLFEHLIKQPPAAYGADTLDRLHASFVENNFNVRELMVDIVTIAAMHR
ncbi:PA14 domain protein [Rosistilla oblonga]|uniref:PA14 domain protein n=2 Tax=Rosistilla oblonga TaxID=2527990 RepID=A0A518IVS0_9BACT|nr:PA14 domain protein [Rosistilla oblonga]